MAGMLYERTALAKKPETVVRHELDTLKLCREMNKCQPDKIWHFAEQCRVWNVMRPYVEATL